MSRLTAALLLGLAAFAPAAAAAPDSEPPRDLFGSLERDLDEFSLVSDKPHVSFHRPNYVLPVSYSEEYPEEETEALFQISLKQQLFKRNVFFAYTQRSFWQVYNGKASRPFRETNYNPEIFFRWKDIGHSPWGLDAGGDHESNGKSLPDSRSWNRLYLSAFREDEDSLAYFKVWYRLPEKARETPNDPRGDDNPDIDDYYGWGEVTLQHGIFAEGMATLFLRGNPATGKGGVQFMYSAPFGDYAFWQLYLWHGYGESLLDYDKSVTRLALGFAVSR